MTLHDAVILSARRTPIGRYLGGLAGIAAPDLGAVAIKSALEHARVDAADVDEVIMGNVITAGLGQAPARQAALKAGIPPTVAALTVNKVCGSGLKAAMLAGQAVRLGDANVVVAGGQENMSRAPFLVEGVRQGIKFGDQKFIDAMLQDGLTCAFEQCHMGLHAEHTAETDNISREDQDAFAAQSQQRAAQAQQDGAFSNEIEPVDGGKRVGMIEHDEGVRADTTAEGLGKLRPAFTKDGSVTAGNASTLNDGAAAVVVASAQYAQDKGLKPMAKIVASATAGTEPKDLFIAPAFAVEQVCEKAGIKVSDIDLFELNEAFASQSLACMRRLKLDGENVNVHGGAIALGHPIGGSGARCLVTLLHAMAARNARLGCVSLCLGGGNAVAMIVERSA
ncbi:MAG: acetyl-CoA C-acyltransferase [Phycisphaerales bacterium JB063]